MSTDHDPLSRLISLENLRIPLNATPSFLRKIKVSRSTHQLARITLFILLTLCLAAFRPTRPAHAQSGRTYTTADGLPSNNIQALGSMALKQQDRSPMGVLTDTEGWLTKETIGQRLKHPPQLTKRGLTALCYHGLAVHEHWQRYCQAGHLFGTWFERYARAILAPDAPMTPAAAETIVQQITNVYTGGGSYIGGDVEMDGGDFVNRDQAG